MGKNIKHTSPVIGLSILSCSMFIHQAIGEDDVFQQKHYSKTFWLEGKAAEGLCGTQMLEISP